MKAKHLLWAAPLLLAACSQKADNQASNYTAYVDTHIGTGGHGHVFMGANVPYGMVQLGPTSVPETWDWCSGYHESDSTVIGFSHTHLEGTGIGDLFDVTVMPVVGDVTYSRGNDSIPGSGLWSYADRSKEISVPGYYSVPLSRYNVLAELTATNRVGMHRYTFPATDSAAIVFDLENGGCWDKPTETHIEAVDSTHVQGYRYSTGWAKDQKEYFYAELSKPMTSWELKGENNMYGRASFATDSAEQVLMKVAISPTSIEGAKANMAAELPGWDFDATRKAADKAWNDELSRIKITTNDSIERTKFYSALYRTMIVPATFNDVDGSYYGADLKVHKGDKNAPNYTIFSLWDTYRAALPLTSIINPELSGKFASTMVRIADEQGRLPVWHLWGNETDCMVGNPGIIAVADAIVKQAPGLDRDKAYAALLKTATDTARGYGMHVEYGYIPCDKMTEAIAFDMEFAIADAAIARAAEAMATLPPCANSLSAAIPTVITLTPKHTSFVGAWPMVHGAHRSRRSRPNTAPMIIAKAMLGNTHGLCHTILMVWNNVSALAKTCLPNLIPFSLQARSWKAPMRHPTFQALSVSMPTAMNRATILSTSTPCSVSLTKPLKKCAMYAAIFTKQHPTECQVTRMPDRCQHGTYSRLLDSIRLSRLQAVTGLVLPCGMKRNLLFPAANL